MPDTTLCRDVRFGMFHGLSLLLVVRRVQQALEMAAPAPEYITLQQTPFSRVARCTSIPSQYTDVNLGLEYEHSRAAAIHQPVQWRKDVFTAVSKILLLGQLVPVRTYSLMYSSPCHDVLLGPVTAGTER